MRSCGILAPLAPANHRVRPTMPSGVFDSILLRDSWSTEELRSVFSDENRVQKWYDVEATLASEQAAFGIVPREAAGEIIRNAKVEKVYLAEIARAMGGAKHPLVPALRALQKLCKPELGEWLHYGPTTQDILDTGMALQLKEAHAIILRDLRGVGRALYALAERHRATLMPGRTHGVQALPITFGHKCAIWLREDSRHRERLGPGEKRVFVGSLVGAVGTMASFGPRAIELEAAVMKRLGLAQADISWHPARDRFAEYASVLGLIAGTLTKPDGSWFSTANIPRLKIEYQLNRAIFFRYVGQYTAQEVDALRDPRTGDTLIVNGTRQARGTDTEFRNDFLR